MQQSQEKPAHRRHDLSNEKWKLPKSHLQGRKGVWGGVAKDNPKCGNESAARLMSLDAEEIDVYQENLFWASPTG
jgi:hypothetical protein